MRYNVLLPIYKKVNKDFFKIWTPNMAYVLGFFAADGYVTVNRRGGQFWCMDLKDKKVIENIKKVIKSEHSIGVRKRKEGQHTTYRLQIGSIEMCNDLRKLGFNTRKTKSLAVPNVPKEYFPNFVRGYFDGDGNVWTGYIHKDRNKKRSYLCIQTVFTSCSFDFLEKLRARLEGQGILNGRIRKGKGEYFRLTYSINSSLKLHDFMYNELGTSKLFLHRKKYVFTKYIKMRP